MLTVYKYDIPIADTFELKLPRSAKFLAFQAQNNQPKIWMLVDPDDKRVIDCEFRFAATGEPIEEPEGNLIYRGTCQIDGGALIFHLFEVIRF